MRPAFPTSDYYGGSVPSRPARPTVDPARIATPAAWPVAGPERFPCSPTDRSSKEAPGYTPAASPRLRRGPSPWPPRPANVTSPGVARPTERRARTAPSPHPPGWSWWDTLGGFTHRFLAYTSSTRSPDPQPSGSAGHAPALSGPLATLTGTSRVGLPPASPPCHDKTAAKVSHLHSIGQRLTAHPLVAPPRIVAGKPHDQLLHLPGYRRPSAAGGRVGPAPGHQAPVPAQQRLGPHQEHRPSRPWKQTAQRSEQRTILGLQAGPWMLAALHRKLVA
jgi:hypothetical protein